MNNNNNCIIVMIFLRSLELLLDNESERLQALRIIRKTCAISPQHFPNAFTHSLSAIAMCSHGPSKDQLHRACVATLCELCKILIKYLLLYEDYVYLIFNLFLLNRFVKSSSICGRLWFESLTPCSYYI